MKSDSGKRLRRKSMLGTALLALGAIAVVAYLVMGGIWLGCAALVLFVVAVVTLYQVGRSLP